MTRILKCSFDFYGCFQADFLYSLGLIFLLFLFTIVIFISFSPSLNEKDPQVVSTLFCFSLFRYVYLHGVALIPVFIHLGAG